MNWPKRSLWVSIAIALSFTSALPARADLPDSLTEIGAARLKVFFWTIYDCYLYSKDGTYRGVGLIRREKRSLRRERDCKTASLLPLIVPTGS